ncbi:MAG: cell division topological specificity factor MinE [Candidatus Eremiobacteraeota bacterium]|nr:cell division topological specificity factor MinE [Candidatus Eremiobacteraeota bacterium]
MIEFFNRLFGRGGSSATAKERLRLVLLSDHLALAPNLVDDLKRELVDVISRYVEVDRENIELNFEQREKVIAMLANVPILSMHPATRVNGAKSSSKRTTDGTKRPRRRRKRATATNTAAATNTTPANVTPPVGETIPSPAPAPAHAEGESIQAEENAAAPTS